MSHNSLDKNNHCWRDLYRYCSGRTKHCIISPWHPDSYRAIRLDNLAVPVAEGEVRARSPQADQRWCCGPELVPHCLTRKLEEPISHEASGEEVRVVVAAASSFQEDLPQVPSSALVVAAGGWGGLARLHACC
jgi:hypothetical protein